MTATGQIVAYHIAFVVPEIEAATARYGRLLGLSRWHQQDVGAMIIAYGGRPGAGIAFEIIQPTRPDHAVALDMLKFLDKHGPGVHHVGFWAPDVRKTLEEAVSEGGTVMALNFEQANSTVIQLTMPSVPEEFRNIGFLDDGLTNVRWELVGPPADQGLRQWLGSDFPDLIKAPPW